MPLPWQASQTSLTPEGIERQRRLAEALMMSGMDASPVQHWTQGAARLAQALAGTYNMNKAETAAAALKRQQDLQAATERAIAQNTPKYDFQPEGIYQMLPGQMPSLVQERPMSAYQREILKAKQAGQRAHMSRAADYTRGAPQGMRWVDPMNPDAGFEPVKGYQAKIPSEVAGKVAMMDVAKKGIEDTRQEFEKAWGLTGTAQSMVTNLPFVGDAPVLSGAIGRARRNVRIGVEAALRVMTGAAAPEQEVRRYTDMFTPGPLDDAASTKQKLDALMSFMEKANQVINQGRGGAIGEQPEDVGAAAQDAGGLDGSSDGFDTFDDLAPNLSEGDVFRDNETGKRYKVENGEIVEIP